MAELQFEFDLVDGKKIYGILQAVDDPTAPVVVFVHGISSHMREKAIRFAAYAAVEAGYTALRLNLYGTEPDARDLIDCTIDTHVSDVTTVLQAIRSSGRKIALVGHSLGGVVMQRIDRSLFDVAVLWDPTDVAVDDFSKWPDVSRNPANGNWVLEWTATQLEVSQAFYDSWWNAGPDRHDMEHPTKIICAGASDLQAACERYKNAQSQESELVTIPNATHDFGSREATEQLYVETVKWIKENLK